jgi:hypothetical protein
MENFAEQLASLKLLEEYIASKVKEQVTLVPEETYRSAEINEIAAALSKAQGEFPKVRNNSENPFFKSTYADFDNIVCTTRPALSKNGLSFTQHQIIKRNEPVILVTTLLHSSSQWMSTRHVIAPPKNDPQSYGSTLSYAKRTSYQSLLGITTTDDQDDDDAEVAMHDTREAFAAGTGLNHKYNPREEKAELISRDQVDQLHRELNGYPAICQRVLDGWKIQALEYMPKAKFQASLDKIRELIAAENEAKLRADMRKMS